MSAKLVTAGPRGVVGMVLSTRPESRSIKYPVTGEPPCQNVPALSRRRPIARIFSSSSGVSSISRPWTRLSGKSSDPVLGQKLLFLEPGNLGSLVRAQGPAPLQLGADGKYPVPEPGLKKDREY